VLCFSVHFVFWQWPFEKFTNNCSSRKSFQSFYAIYFPELEFCLVSANFENHRKSQHTVWTPLERNISLPSLGAPFGGGALKIICGRGGSDSPNFSQKSSPPLIAFFTAKHSSMLLQKHLKQIKKICKIKVVFKIRAIIGESNSLKSVRMYFVHSIIRFITHTFSTKICTKKVFFSYCLGTM